MEINNPQAVAEVTAAFQRYEKALIENDIEILKNIFWRNELTLRYAMGVNSYGHDAITAARAKRPAADRTLAHTVITAYGRDYATANTEFTRTGSGRSGRQSQTWVRFGDGWHVVAAHVSWFDPET